MADKKKPNLFQKVSSWVEDVVEWVEATFSDPALSAQIRADLGLDASGPAPVRAVDPATKAKIDEFVAKQDVDEASLMAVVAEVKALVDTGMTFADAVKTQGVDGRDVLWLLFKVWIADSFKARNPAAYGLLTLAGIFTEDDEALGALDLAPIGRLLKGEARGDAEDVVDRISFLVGTTMVALDTFVGAVGGTVDAAYGWDPEPDDDPASARVAARALTVRFHIPVMPVSPMLTLIGVPAAHGGPGILMSLGAALQVSHSTGDTTYTFSAGANGAFAVYLGAGAPRALSAATPSFALRTEPAEGAAGKPALVVGTSDASRLEIGALAWGIEVGADFAAFRLAVRRGKLVISLGQGDGFLSSLGGSVEVPFDLGLIADTKDGVRFEGGTGLKVNLPVAASLFGVFTVQYVELEVMLDTRVLLELRGGFSLKLGPFTATVDKLGLSGDLTSLSDGADIGDVVKFLPPKGIGLRLDAGVVKGGGYLFIDPERGEYAGALELTLAGSFSIKAICLITTKRPDGTDGWSLLLLIYGQFSVHVAFGIFLTGVGGLIGLHHRVDVQALTDGMKTGVLDDILFPANPVGDAPRIINRYRQLFPFESDSLVLGPMLELAFSQPPIVYVRLGLLFEVRNALGGDKPLTLTKVVLIGQLLAQLPPKATGSPAVLKLLVDVVGFYDAQEKFLMIRARLRDSFVGIEGFATLNLSGELLLAMRFGDDPSFVLSAGGFHPAFKDVPAGVPAVLERMAVSFGFGPMRFRCETYFAITSNSVQAGFKIAVSAKLGPASIEGHLGFDALIYLKPKFRFIVGIDFAVSLKAFGSSLCAVTVTMQLEGPGEWHAVGHFSFSILWWDVEVGFDEKWGSAPAIEEQTTSATQAIRSELSDPQRMLPEAPAGGAGLVTLASVESGPVPFAHPLGRLTIRQKAFPFEVTVDRLGTKRLTEGSVRYSVSDVLVGEKSVKATTTPVLDHFARAQFMEVGEQERIGGKSFERFPCGVSVGTDAYRVDDIGAAVEATYEEKILEPQPRIARFPWTLTAMDARALPDTLLDAHVALGAAARSVRAMGDAIASGGPGGATVRKDPALAVVDSLSLSPATPLLAAAAGSDAIAHQAAGPGSVVIEAFELAGV
ncbi:hypothetical protein Pth03_26350 [Planotetraspora thailandica]|uniref:DUF6603 domain-containing protein n=1 Tax=Planotetraspora thailandica TaxID=487172 RepID=A0A8J3XW07_9ACTN|nr:DUF6603 domain-containing protein [Planotetraspora thailandica]GII54246.1 hypothetical protein Pth03_26350 [Planotetraspora thailandica]